MLFSYRNGGHPHGKIPKAIPHNSKCRYGERGAADAKPKAQIILEHFGNADAVPQPPERCLSRKAGIVQCCLKGKYPHILSSALHSNVQGFFITAKEMKPIGKLPKHFTAGTSGDCRCSRQCRQLAGVFALSCIYSACPSSKAAVPAFEKIFVLGGVPFIKAGGSAASQ